MRGESSGAAHRRHDVGKLPHRGFRGCTIGREIAVVEIAGVAQYLHQQSVTPRHHAEVAGIERVVHFRLRNQTRSLAAYGNDRIIVEQRPGAVAGGIDQGALGQRLQLARIGEFAQMIFPPAGWKSDISMRV